MVQELLGNIGIGKEKVFDVVVACCSIFGEEPGYYLAYRVGRILILKPFIIGTQDEQEMI